MFGVSSEIHILGSTLLHSLSLVIFRTLLISRHIVLYFIKLLNNDCLCVTLWTCHSFLAEITQNAVPPLTPGTNQKMSQALAASFKSFEKEQQRLGIPKGTEWIILLVINPRQQMYSNVFICTKQTFANFTDQFVHIVLASVPQSSKEQSSNNSLQPKCCDSHLCSFVP